MISEELVSQPNFLGFNPETLSFVILFFFNSWPVHTLLRGGHSLPSPAIMLLLGQIRHLDIDQLTPLPTLTLPANRHFFLYYFVLIQLIPPFFFLGGEYKTPPSRATSTGPINILHD